MNECYFDIEIGYIDESLVKRLKNGGRVPVLMNKIKIITAQYQFLDETGKPKGPIRILREWKNSEEDIIRKMATLINPRCMWEFIPVGYNIYFDLGVLRRRALIYGINYDEWFIYHELPVIDIKHICVGMNNFKLKNSGLDKFTGKESSGIHVPVWYMNKEYDKIEDYIVKEFEEFAVFYQKLKQTLPQFRQQYGFFKNENNK